MAAFRDEDGKVVQDAPSGEGRRADKPVRMGSAAGRRWHELAAPVESAGDGATVRIDRSPEAAPADRAAAADRAPRPGRAVPRPKPVAWLVVTSGPGAGRSLALLAGRNKVGSGRSDDVRLDFGDDAVAAAHAVIVYDDHGRTFHLQRGPDERPVFLDDQAVTGIHTLPGRAQIRLGETTLRFVPLCGPAFDWAESGGGAGPSSAGAA